MVVSITSLLYHLQLLSLEVEAMVLQRLLRFLLLGLLLVLLSQLLAVGTLLHLLLQLITPPKIPEQKSSLGIPAQENFRSSTEQELSILLRQ